MSCVVACLKEDGTHPVACDKLIIAITTGTMVDMTLANKGGGIMSEGLAAVWHDHINTSSMQRSMISSVAKNDSDKLHENQKRNME